MSLITDLRAKTGASFVECRDALRACDNDLKLAQGYLHFNGLALNVRPQEGETREEAYERWVMRNAKEWAETH